MSVPDNELIAEVMMFAEGFASAKVLAQKNLRDKQVGPLFLSIAKALESHLKFKHEVKIGQTSTVVPLKPRCKIM